VLWQLVEGDLEPAHPIAVTFPASSKAIDALLGTKRRSPRVVPDETKLAFTNSASRSTARSKTFGAVGHWSLLLALPQLFVDHPFFTIALHELVRFSNACSLGPTQLNVGSRRKSLVTERSAMPFRRRARDIGELAFESRSERDANGEFQNPL
jgi:hypothetical protein